MWYVALMMFLCLVGCGRSIKKKGLHANQLDILQARMHGVVDIPFNARVVEAKVVSADEYSLSYTINGTDQQIFERYMQELDRQGWLLMTAVPHELLVYGMPELIQIVEISTKKKQVMVKVYVTKRSDI